jgi:hypothetical protein
MEKGIYELSSYQYKTLVKAANSSIPFFVVLAAQRHTWYWVCETGWELREVSCLEKLGLIEQVIDGYRDLIDQTAEEDGLLFYVFRLTDAGQKMFYRARKRPVN